jgi:hypothetical protein
LCLEVCLWAESFGIFSGGSLVAFSYGGADSFHGLIPSSLNECFVFTRRCGTHHRSAFDPLRKMRTQSCAPRGQSVVVVYPVGNLLVVDTHDGGSVYRDWDP